MDPLKVDDPISVWWLDKNVLPARVVHVVGEMFSYEIVWPNGCRGATGSDHLNGEGRWWARGTEGATVNALRTVVTLRSE